jgi:protein-L-isoaspartate(D-aspartate) O-methyltransferase
MNKKSNQKKIGKDYEVPRDAVCVCKSCKHDFARDCIKVSCTCCKEDEHAMTLDGPYALLSPGSRPESYYEEAYEKRTDDLIKAMQVKGFLTDSKVEDAIRKAPRHFFVPSNFIKHSYENGSLPTKNGQTISQPSVVAKMTEWLDVKKGNKVLEIGCGSGWQSAILSFLVEDSTVYSIEKSSQLVEFAKQNHAKAGIKNVEIIQGDGSLGLPDKSPFDRIIITAACPKVPKPLVEQLSIDGLLVAPIGEYIQSMVLLKKTKDGIKELKRELGYLFLPLKGKYGFK